MEKMITGGLNELGRANVSNRNIGLRQAIREAGHIIKGAFETSFQEFVDDRFATGDKNPPENESGYIAT